MPTSTKAADQVPDVGVSAMAGVGVRDYERPIVDGRGGLELLRAHARAAKYWFLSAASSIRTMGAPSSGTWLSG